MRHGEVQVAGEGTAGAFLVELQVPHDRLSVGGTVCGLLLSRLAFGGDSVLARTVGAGAGNGSSGSVGAGTRVRPGTDRARGVLAVALVVIVGHGRHQGRALQAVLIEVTRGVV